MLWQHGKANINLAELQKTLDQQGLELVENQKESVIGRKALADKTKEFKKIPEEEKGSAFKTLLKAYQTEIDNLTRRCKASETAFLHVYKLLAEAPDPYPLLDAAVDQTVKVAEAQVLESELNRLREENGELRGKLGELSSLENAKKKAETRAEVLEEKMEAMIEERVKAKENELNATYDERILNFEERSTLRIELVNVTSNAKSPFTKINCESSKRQPSPLRRSCSITPIAKVVAKLAEMDMIVADLERANGRVAAVERRNEILRAEIEAVRSGSDAADRVKALETQISELERESARLLQALEAQKTTTAEVEATAQKKADEAARELAQKASEIESFRQKVKQYYDYDEIKRELEIMKFVEFAGVDDPEDGSTDVRMPNPNAEKANKQQAQSLESLLMTKNKRLLDEVTRFRIMHTELEASVQGLKDSLDHCRTELDKQRQLNEKLEADLLQVNPHASSGDRQLSGGALGLGGTTGSSTPQDGLSGLNLGQKSLDVSRRDSPAPPGASADASILPIVTSQRDRFRQRNAELEEELRKQYEIISELRSEIKTLQADNMKLYEKVRYMQSYRDAGPNATLTTSAAPIGSGVNDGISKYSSMYEQSMNPFEAFRGRVRSLDNMV
ncbi:hypothetical protein FRC00_003305 [Tulasnella sp. 408]|nr:hypothetical protein FRC00_003305 [Tulasnella sp. 408]